MKLLMKLQTVHGEILQYRFPKDAEYTDILHWIVDLAGSSELVVESVTAKKKFSRLDITGDDIDLQKRSVTYSNLLSSYQDEHFQTVLMSVSYRKMPIALSIVLSSGYSSVTIEYYDRNRESHREFESRYLS